MRDWEVERLIAKFDPRINLQGKLRNTPTLRRDFNREVGYSELKRAYELSALIVKLHGETFLPIFERLHNEMQSYGEKQKLVDKALKIAQNFEGFELSRNR